MARKRLIFSLLYDEGWFALSRNFRLQRIGDLAWLQDNYGFSDVSRFIDELVILNVSRKAQIDWDQFLGTVSALAKSNFVPIAVGGFGQDLERAKVLLANGADKLVVNSALFEEPFFVEELAGKFGRQSVVGSIDIELVSESQFRIILGRGERERVFELESLLKSLPLHSTGELLIRSVRNDGTGQGLDTELYAALDLARFCLPVVVAGGTGKAEHVIQALCLDEVSGLSTANLLNFIGPGLQELRKSCTAHGIDLAQWPSTDSLTTDKN